MKLKLKKRKIADIENFGTDNIWDIVGDLRLSNQLHNQCRFFLKLAEFDK